MIQQIQKIIFILVLMVLFSTAVLAAYTPTAPTAWGDFVEKKDFSSAFEFGKDYSFSVLSKVHTLQIKSEVIETITPPPSGSKETPKIDKDPNMAVFLDGDLVIGPVVQKSHKLYFTQVVDSVPITVDISADPDVPYKTGFIKISTPGIQGKDLVSSSSNEIKDLLISKLGNVNAGTYSIVPGYGVKFLVDETPFTVVYHSKEQGGKYFFIVAFQHLNGLAEIIAAPTPAKSDISAEISDQFAQTTMTDNFWNKFTLYLKVNKFEVINNIPLIHFSLYGKHNVAAEVIDSFQGMTNEKWGPLDFSDPSTSQVNKYANSQNGLTPKIYGPLKIGPETYYVAQSMDLKDRSTKIWIKGGQFNWKNDKNEVLGPVSLNEPRQSGITAAGKAMSVLLPGSSTKIYFVPLEFQFKATTGFLNGLVKFFVGSEKAFGKAYPSVEILDIAVEKPSGLPGTGLPGAPSVGTAPSSPSKASLPLEGDLNGDGKVDTDDVVWIKQNPSTMWTGKLKSSITHLNALIKAMIDNWGK